MTTPICAGHIMLHEPHKDGDSYDIIPSQWSEYRFDALDVLYVSPFCVNVVNNKKVFAFENNDYTKRLSWVITTARTAKPEVKIIAMQMYSAKSALTELKTADDIASYTDSVAAFLNTWNKTTQVDGKTVSLRVDGYDIDYETPNNEVESVPIILSQIRRKIDALSTTPRFYISVTPVPDPDNYLKDVEPHVDYVVMQNYSGGKDMDPKAFIASITNLKPNKVLYGVKAEEGGENSSKTFDDVLSAYEGSAPKEKLAGIMVWRLNSSNHVYENTVQVAIYNYLHKVTLPNSPNLNAVKKGWDK